MPWPLDLFLQALSILPPPDAGRGPAVADKPPSSVPVVSILGTFEPSPYAQSVLRIDTTTFGP